MNPHPTKCKPCKIGRKHIGAPGIRVQQKRKNTDRLRNAIELAKHRKWKEQVRLYFLSERDSYPS